MPLQYRDLRSSDVRNLVDAVATDPVLGPRYAGALDALERGLLAILERRAVLAPVFEWVEGNDRSLVGFGIRSFIADTFARALTTPPFPWAGRELVVQTARGQTPVLSDAELRRLNASEGVNLLLWFAWMRPEFRRPDVMNFYMQVFVAEHRGYRLKQLISQCDMVETVEARLNAGLPLLQEDGSHTTVSSKPLLELVTEPHCFHLTREHVLSHPASWFSILFEYEPPRIFFSPSEQRLLQAAMKGGTDDELASELEISVSGVKKTWRAIYARVADRAPEWMPEGDSIDAFGGERGRGRKHRLLSQLRDHPGELRPLPRDSHRNAIRLK